MIKGCTDYIVMDLRPMHALEGAGLHSLLSSFSTIHMAYQPIDLEEVSYFLPNRNTVQAHIGKNATQIRLLIKKDLQSAVGRGQPGGGIALDLWTDSYRQLSYLGIITHYINEKFEMCQRLIVCKSLPSDRQKDADFILVAIKKEIEKYGLNLDEINERVVFVTDRGKNIVKALRLYNPLTCALHFLCNVIKKTFDCGRPKDVLNACKSIVGYIKRSGKNDQFHPSLKSSSEVRWNYAVTMMKSIVANDNWTLMLNILEESNKMNILDGVTKEELESLIQFLDIFHMATKSMETTSKPTVFAVLAWFDKIERFLKRLPTDAPIIQTAKENVEAYFLLTIAENQQYLRSKYHLMSNFLHPGLKNLAKFSPMEKDQIINEVICTLCSQHSIHHWSYSYAIISVLVILFHIYFSMCKVHSQSWFYDIFD